MKERGILFTPENYDKTAAGVKTMTRRIVKPQPNVVHAIYGDGSLDTNLIFRDGDQRIHCPFGTVGDRLYVKEGICYGRPALPSGIGIIPIAGKLPKYRELGSKIAYRRDWQSPDPPPWRSPLFMPKWAARLWLDITEVRVERLLDISDDDAKAEGADDEADESPESVMAERYGSGFDNGYFPEHGYDFGYKHIWESIHGTGSWKLNPWVWVIRYQKVEEP